MTENPSHAQALVFVSFNATDMMLKENQRNLGAICEVAIFNSLRILQNYEAVNPFDYSDFESEYIIEFYKFSEKLNIVSLLSYDFFDFLNNRFQLYGEQLKSMHDGTNDIPYKIYFNFYKTPLLLNSWSFRAKRSTDSAVKRSTYSAAKRSTHSAAK